MVEETIKNLGSVFNIKVQKSIDDFLGWEIHEGFGRILLAQHRIVDKLLKSNTIKEDTNYETPSAPGFFVVRPSESEKVDNLTQKWYRSNIGCLLYLIKLSRPDLANSVRTLSKVMDGAAPGHVKELKRLIQFVGNTKRKGLKMHVLEEDPWEIVAYSNSDYAGDKEGRKSATGIVVLISGVPISWKSKGQPTVTLSSTEFKYVALCETVRQVKFISQYWNHFKLSLRDQFGCMRIK